MTMNCKQLLPTTVSAAAAAIAFHMMLLFYARLLFYVFYAWCCWWWFCRELIKIRHGGIFSILPPFFVYYYDGEFF
jgi:hypothetical protein